MLTRSTYARFISVAAALGLVATSLIAPSASGAPADELAGKTTITGDRTAVTSVVLPKPVRIADKPFNNPFAKIETTGQIGGVVLQQDVPRKGVEAMAFSIDPCSDTSCDDDRLEITQIVDYQGSEGRRTTLPAGRYLLYLVTDGSPTEVTLTLPGLAGQTTVAPMGATNSDFSDLDAGPVGDQAKATYGASADHTLRTMGLSLVALEVKADAHLAGQYGSCIHQTNGDLPTDGNRFCGGFLLVAPSQPDEEGSRALVVGLGLMGEGRYTHDVSYEGAAATTSLHSFGFSLSYEQGNDQDRALSTTFSFEP